MMLFEQAAAAAAAPAEEAEGHGSQRRRRPVRWAYISRRIEDYAGTHLMLPVSCRAVSTLNIS